MHTIENEMTELENSLLKDCTLCPRACHVNRLAGAKGFCRKGPAPEAARAALHMWEEPCISGTRGSGAVFFSGCSLHCVYCQNNSIALSGWGRELSHSRLAEVFLELQAKGAANINLVTAAHFLPSVIQALKEAKEQGLSIPVVYNSGGYESLSSLKLLDGLVDVYLPDLKYLDSRLAEDLSHAPDYPERAKEAIEEMVRQTGECMLSSDGYMQKGTMVRHLILPGHTRNAKEVLAYLYHRYQDRIFISLLSQYTPVMKQTLPGYAELNRTLTAREHEKVMDYAISLGVQNGYYQEQGTAKESFIPSFEGEGL
ncbi:MAG: radical SAM protein [Blautia sp.]|nr:radical SAM protein [Blautia sp.]